MVIPLLDMVANTIKDRAKFSIYDLSPIDHVKKSFVPALFATAIGDDFIKPHHC